MSSRADIARQRTGKRVAFRKSADQAAWRASLRARRSATPVNAAAAQVIARRAVRSAMRSNLEMKYFVTVDAGADDWHALGPQPIPFCAVPQGNTDLSRVGDQINLRNFTFRAYWYAGAADCHARVILFQWHPENTVTEPSNGIIPGGGSIVNGIHNMDFLRQGKMRILADWRFPVQQTAGGPNRSGVLFYRTSKMRKLCAFNGAASTYCTNNLFLFYCSSAAVGTPANYPKIRWTSEVSFVDP